MPPRKRTTPATSTAPDPEVSPAQAAATEATGGDDTINFTFRDAKFSIPRAKMADAKMLMAMAARQYHMVLFALLGQKDSLQAIELAEDGESIYAFASDFLGAMNAAAGVGNSSTSRKS